MAPRYARAPLRYPRAPPRYPTAPPRTATRAATVSAETHAMPRAASAASEITLRFDMTFLLSVERQEQRRRIVPSTLLKLTALVRYCRSHGLPRLTRRRRRPQTANDAVPRHLSLHEVQ